MNDSDGQAGSSSSLRARLREANMKILQLFLRYAPSERQRVFILTIIIGVLCGFAAVAFHVIYFLLSLMLEPNSASLQPMERLVQIILTPSFAFPMYWLLARIDRWTHCEVLQESGGVEL